MGTAWKMPIAVIGKPTGDGRQFDAGALSHRKLPLPLRYVPSDSGGHNNAVIVGHIARIGKEKDGLLPAQGEFYDDDSWPDDVRNAALAARKLTGNKVIGPSVDLDQMEAEHVPEPKAYAAWKKEQAGKLKAAKLAHGARTGGDCGCGGPVMAEEAFDGPRLRMIRSGRLASATLVHIPAFAELAGHAKLTPIDSSDPNVDGTTSSAMVAGALIEFDWADVEWNAKIEDDAEMAICKDKAGKQVPCDADMSISEDTTDDDVPNRAKAQDRKKPKRDPETVKGSQDTQEMAQEDGESDEDFAARKKLPRPSKAGQPEPPATDGEQSQGATWADENREAHKKMAALMAGAAPAAPPREWFDDPKLTGPTPLHIGDDGRVYGHVAAWGTCHVGIADSCTIAPKSQTSYAYFHTGEAVTADGSRVPVGRLTYGGGHAAPNLGFRAAAEHYDRTSSMGALVRAGEDEHGIWVAGAIVPEADEAAVRTMRATPLSGDWRRVGGNLEMVAALHVNTAGFPIPRVLTASVVNAVTEDEELLSLVAAGALPLVDEADAPLTAALDTEALGRAIARGMLAEQQEAALRAEREGTWRELVAAATADDRADDYDEAMDGLLTALVQE